VRIPFFTPARLMVLESVFFSASCRMSSSTSSSSWMPVRPQ
jgi:hypothetical protein